MSQHLALAAALAADLTAQRAALGLPADAELVLVLEESDLDAGPPARVAVAVGAQRSERLDRGSLAWEYELQVLLSAVAADETPAAAAAFVAAVEAIPRRYHAHRVPGRAETLTEHQTLGPYDAATFRRQARRLVAVLTLTFAGIDELDP